MRKNMSISYPDGSIHNVIVTQADVTKNGHIVICYYDITDGMRAAFSEIIKEDDQYYKNPNHHEWEYYVNRFQPFDREISDFIVGSLPDKLGLYNKTANKPELPPDPINIKNNKDNEVYRYLYKEKEPEKVKVKNGKSYYITAVMYANRGESLVAYDGTDLPPAFFYKPIISEFGSLEEVYKKTTIESKKDEDELLNKMKNRLGNIVDVSLIPEDRKFELSSGNRYFVTFASCDDEGLFQEVSNSKKVCVDISTNVSDSLYPDNLSIALHHELPLEITINGKTVRYEANSNIARKK